MFVRDLKDTNFLMCVCVCVQGRMMQGTQGMGMMGTIGSGSQMRPSGMTQHQQRPAQSSLRPASSPSSSSPVPQVGVFECS